MVTVLEECTTKDQNSVVLFLWAKGLSAKDIHKEMFYIYCGSVCCVMRFTTGLRNFVKISQGCSKDADDETEVRKWLRQKSKDFYAAGFDALAKRWDKCINVGGGYVKK
jgi:hypothetical protein